MVLNFSLALAPSPLSQNVVVTNQPNMRPEVHHVAVAPRAREHLILTVVMMVICGLHCNWPAFVCLLPALLFALVVGRPVVCVTVCDSVARSVAMCCWEIHDWWLMLWVDYVPCSSH